VAWLPSKKTFERTSAEPSAIQGAKEKPQKNEGGVRSYGVKGKKKRKNTQGKRKGP